MHRVFVDSPLFLTVNTQLIFCSHPQNFCSYPQNIQNSSQAHWLYCLVQTKLLLLEQWKLLLNDLSTFILGSLQFDPPTPESPCKRCFSFHSSHVGAKLTAWPAFRGWGVDTRSLSLSPFLSTYIYLSIYLSLMAEEQREILWPSLTWLKSNNNPFLSIVVNLPESIIIHSTFLYIIY